MIHSIKSLSTHLELGILVPSSKQDTEVRWIQVSVLSIYASTGLNRE